MNNKNKLCIDARMLNHSGIGTYLRMLLPYICNAFDVTVLGNPEHLNKLELEAKIINFQSPVYSIDEQKQYKRVIPSTNLFWSPHYNAPLFAGKTYKRIVTIHDVFHLAHFKQLNIKQKVYAKLVINCAAKSSNAIVTVSNFSKNEILKFTGTNEDKISVIYNGVKQKTLIRDIGAIREKYNLPIRYILYVGNVKPHKNLKLLAKAFLKLPVAIQCNYKIVVVGKVDGFITGDSALLNLINNNPLLKQNVIFTGFVAEDDMDMIYASASLFVFPSLYEGFGLPPLEAMLNGCPVLASNQNSLPEVCGEGAEYFDPLNENELAFKIEQVLTDEQKKNIMKNRGTERIKLFNWADSAAKHIDLFNLVINH
jgi:glycosyltransferase involved in cell wall biosynthesis